MMLSQLVIPLQTLFSLPSQGSMQPLTDYFEGSQNLIVRLSFKLNLSQTFFLLKKSMVLPLSYYIYLIQI